jgi:hypothetical protein
MSQPIPGLCSEDVVVVESIIRDWLELSMDRRKETASGWEPMWGQLGVFNGNLQQGDCGYNMCSDNCARVASDYLNEHSKNYIYSFLKRDSEERLRGACTVGEESCGWCDGFSVSNTDNLCGFCGCSCEMHELVTTSEEASKIGLATLPVLLIAHSNLVQQE